MKYRTKIQIGNNAVPEGVYGGLFSACTPTKIESTQWYAAFRERCLASIGRDFLPVYRMADGEFKFLIGDRIDFKAQNLPRELISYTMRQLGVRLDHTGWMWRIRRRSVIETIWGEKYESAERRRLKPVYVQQLREIAADGVLAAFFIESGQHWCRAQIAGVLQTMGKAGIKLSNNNYVPFHFPLYMLSGDGAQDFYRNRSVLVVSSFGEEKKKAVAFALKGKGARNVDFITIPPSGSLGWTIPPDDIRPADVTLVAAGIGSSHIILQLRRQRSLVVDVGGLLTCMTRPGWVYHEFIAWK